MEFYSILIHYKLNIFRPPRVEPVWHSCTVIQRICEVDTITLNGLIYILKTCPWAVHQCHSYLRNCFCCLMNSNCSLFNYSLGIILIAFSSMCISIIPLVDETISFSWIPINRENNWNIFHVMSVCNF